MNKNCYIDKRLCTGARFTFCQDCKKAQALPEYPEQLKKAERPEQVTAAHCLKTPAKRLFL